MNRKNVASTFNPVNRSKFMFAIKSKTKALNPIGLDWTEKNFTKIFSSYALRDMKLRDILPANRLAFMCLPIFL